LEVPYSDDRELMLDIMRHGSHVEVLAPKELREKTFKELIAAAQIYK
jgi:predicted DNA-binding transcriptional regulator YafY